MLNQYLKDRWIEPANLDHAVNMFPFPKQNGTFCYVYNYVPVNKICRINKNSIPNLRDNIDILASNPFRIALDLRSAYNQILITDKKNQRSYRIYYPLWYISMERYAFRIVGCLTTFSNLYEPCPF